MNAPKDSVPSSEQPVPLKSRQAPVAPSYGPDEHENPEAGTGPSDEAVSHWNSLEVVKVLIAAAVPLSVFLAGALITYSSRKQEEVRAKWDAIGELSQSALERRSRSELLGSAVRRHIADASDSSLAEVIKRKQAYDESYVSWNANIGRHMLVLRRASNARDYSDLESKLQRSLVNAVFTPLDACLTTAYDHVVRGRNTEAGTALESCKAKQLLQAVLDCQYEITNEAYAIAAESPPASSPDPSRRCPSPQ